MVVINVRLTLRTGVRLHVLALRKVSLHVAQGFGVERGGGGETGRARVDARLGGARMQLRSMSGVIDHS